MRSERNVREDQALRERGQLEGEEEILEEGGKGSG